MWIWRFLVELYGKNDSKVNENLVLTANKLHVLKWHLRNHLSVTHALWHKCIWNEYLLIIKSRLVCLSDLGQESVRLTDLPVCFVRPLFVRSFFLSFFSISLSLSFFHSFRSFFLSFYLRITVSLPFTAQTLTIISSKPLQFSLYVNLDLTNRI
jgi:hypothetical protein